MSVESSVRFSLARHTPVGRARLRQRMTKLNSALSSAASSRPLDNLASAIPTFGPPEFWLMLAVLRAELPVPSEVRRIRRAAELDGPFGAIRYVLDSIPSRTKADRAMIVSDLAVIDVTGLLPGDVGSAGRGAGRQLLRAWTSETPIVPVSWNASRRALRTLTAQERSALSIPTTDPTHLVPGSLIVPYRCRFVLLGTVDLPRSAERLVALGQYSGNETASVGYGLAPLLEPDSYIRQRDEPPRFSWHLAAQRSFSRLAALGEGVDRHYRGWGQMLSAIGVVGPEITAFPIPRVTGVLDRGATRELPLAQWNALAREVGLVVGVSAPLT